MVLRTPRRSPVMSPRLENVVVNGASRHRMRKGILLIRNDAQAADTTMRDAIVQCAKRAIAQNEHFRDFTLEISASHSCLVHITTPFLPVYTMNQRNVFTQRLSNVMKIVIQAAKEGRCYVQAAGVNPVGKDIDEQSLSLCADFHEIEIFDEGEVERIYNLYRQFLPELLAISTNAAIYNGTLQKDRSLRMRKNNASFLPHYLS